MKAEKKNNVTYNDRIDEIRAMITALRDERRETEHRPRTREEAIEDLGTAIRTAAAEYSPPLGAVLSSTPEPHSILEPPIRPQTAMAMLAFYFGDVVFEKLASAIEEKLRNGPKPISTEERHQELQALDARLLELEREEVSLIDEAVAQGLRIDHREQLDVRAFLGLPD